MIVALTSDSEIIAKKGYKPEISFEEEKEVLESIKYVDEVIQSPWLLMRNFWKNIILISLFTVMIILIQLMKKS